MFPDDPFPPHYLCSLSSVQSSSISYTSSEKPEIALFMSPFTLPYIKQVKCILCRYVYMYLFLVQPLPLLQAEVRKVRLKEMSSSVGFGKTSPYPSQKQCCELFPARLERAVKYSDSK